MWFIYSLKNICISLLKLWVQWQDCCKWYRANWYLWQWFQVWINASRQRCYRLLPVKECPMRWNALADLPGGDWCSANNCTYCLLRTRGGERIYPLPTAVRYVASSEWMKCRSSSFIGTNKISCAVNYIQEDSEVYNLKYTQTVLDVTFLFLFCLNMKRILV